MTCTVYANVNCHVVILPQLANTRPIIHNNPPSLIEKLILWLSQSVNTLKASSQSVVSNPVPTEPRKITTIESVYINAMFYLIIAFVAISSSTIRTIYEERPEFRSSFWLHHMLIRDV